ncbi:uncharacterized protein BX664DRAFT_293678 [Halteromyces radiatus]|uniref:uncharacterized protein n=1 Tax=Halteromyces radiatus TaxID=101107 RepID=UPI00221F2D72|nr:uncharacterized protein BX664DRAFT_293678 [Halteromyces radiatus]KAI8092554.1 hypothetical protein BX664DRAFT_293678 [Halteromyces radiatus]
MYSPDNYEIMSEIVMVACITALSLFFGRKIAGIEGPVRYVRGLLLLLYGLSWAFDMIACMSTSTNNGNFISCMIGFFNCVLLHTVTKVVLYLYFIEKAYIISVPKSKRLSTTLYVCNLCMLVPYIGLVIMMVIYREELISADFPYFCSIGYQKPASLIVLAYEFVINLMFAGIFIKYSFWPNTAQQTSHQSSSLHMMAKRNITVAIVSAIMAIANYGVVIYYDGAPRGLMAMTVSALDVTVVAGVVQWATSHPAEIQSLEKLLQRGNGDKPVKLEIKQHQEVVVLTEMAHDRV